MLRLFFAFSLSLSLFFTPNQLDANNDTVRTMTCSVKSIKLDAAGGASYIEVEECSDGSEKKSAHKLLIALPTNQGSINNDYQIPDRFFDQPIEGKIEFIFLALNDLRNTDNAYYELNSAALKNGMLMLLTQAMLQNKNVELGIEYGSINSVRLSK